MKFTKLLLASAMIFSLSHATEGKKLLKPDTTKNKKITAPLWMTQDAFTISTIDGKKIHLLSTKKGFTFKQSKEKLALLVVWSTECKSCPTWLEDLDALAKQFPDKLSIYALDIGNTEKEKLKRLHKAKKDTPAAIQKIIDSNHAKLKKFAKSHHLSFPLISALSNQGNLAFAMQTLYKYEFNKPRGKNKKGGGLPFTVVFGYQGQTAGITAGISKKKAYAAYIAQLIKHYEDKK